MPYYPKPKDLELDFHDPSVSNSTRYRRQQILGVMTAAQLEELRHATSAYREALSALESAHQGYREAMQKVARKRVRADEAREASVDSVFACLEEIVLMIPEEERTFTNILERARVVGPAVRPGDVRWMLQYELKYRPKTRRCSDGVVRRLYCRIDNG